MHRLTCKSITLLKVRLEGKGIMSITGLRLHTRLRLKAYVITPILVSGLFFCLSPASAADRYQDVPKDHWASSAVDRVTKAGFLSGDSDYFRGGNYVTRYEMAAVISRILDRIDNAVINQDAGIKKMRDDLSKELADLKQKSDRELAAYSVKVTSVESETRANADEIGIMRGKVNSQEGYSSEVEKLRSEVNILNEKVARQDKINKITWIIIGLGAIAALSARGR